MNPNHKNKNIDRIAIEMKESSAVIRKQTQWEKLEWLEAWTGIERDVE